MRRTGALSESRILRPSRGQVVIVIRTCPVFSSPNSCEIAHCVIITSKQSSWQVPTWIRHLGILPGSTADVSVHKSSGGACRDPTNPVVPIDCFPHLVQTSAFSFLILVLCELWPSPALSLILPSICIWGFFFPPVTILTNLQEPAVSSTNPGLPVAVPNDQAIVILQPGPCLHLYYGRGATLC